MIMHDVKFKNEKTSIEETTLLNSYLCTQQGNENKNNEDFDINAELNNVNNQGSKDIISSWFPDIGKWNIEEIERINGRIRGKLASKWSVEKTIKFFRLVDKHTNERIIRGRRIISGYRKNQNLTGGSKNIDNELELGLGLHKLIEIANRIYGVSNWMNEVDHDHTKILDFEIVSEEETKIDETGERITTGGKYNLCMTTVVRIILADNTIVEKTGYGYSNNLNREMSFRKCRKESVSDGLKRCFGGLIALLLDYEDKVKNGYYKKY